METAFDAILLRFPRRERIVATTGRPLQVLKPLRTQGFQLPNPRLGNCFAPQADGLARNAQQLGQGNC
jgi:hypothetical protein